MAMVPVFCDSCGAVWGSPNFIGGTGSKIRMTGNKVGPCPVCGGMGSVPDGVYDLIDDSLNVVQSAEMPAATLQGLIDLLQSRARGKVTDAEVIEKIESTAPGLVPTVREVLQKPDPIKWVTLLLAILSMYLELHAATPPTAEDIVRALHEKPVPALIAPEKRGAAHGRTPGKQAAKRRRPPKTHAQGKKRRSKKRR